MKKEKTRRKEKEKEKENRQESVQVAPRFHLGFPEQATGRVSRDKDATPESQAD